MAFETARRRALFRAPYERPTFFAGLAQGRFEAVQRILVAYLQEAYRLLMVNLRLVAYAFALSCGSTVSSR